MVKVAKGVIVHRVVIKPKRRTGSKWTSFKVCGLCGKAWRLQANIGICPSCGQDSQAQTRRIRILPTPRAKPKPYNTKTELEKVYDGLQGEWLEWLGVARKYEGKVPHQDRLDIRHDIILELALARQKTTEPIPLYRAYRIASYMVADYYRQQLKLNTGLDCKNCSKAKRQECKKHDLYSVCPKLVKLVSLDTITIDAEGNSHTLRDTIADDNALDLDEWLDDKTFLLGCPMRLIEIATKKVEGEDLPSKDRRYLERYRKRTQMSLFRENSL